MKHNFPEDVIINCKTPHTKTQAKEILSLAIDSDCPMSSIGPGGVDPDYPRFCWDGDDLTSTCANPKTHLNEIFVSYHEFKAFLKGKGKYTSPFNEKLHLVDEYTAEVTKVDVKVGCKKISHATIKKLYLLSVKAQKSKN